MGGKKKNIFFNFSLDMAQIMLYNLRCNNFLTQNQVGNLEMESQGRCHGLL